jgi:hypothetical protein
VVTEGARRATGVTTSGARKKIYGNHFNREGERYFKTRKCGRQSHLASGYGDEKLYGPPQQSTHSFVIHPDNADIMYLQVYRQANKGFIQKTTVGGKTWKNISKPITKTALINKINFLNSL